MSGMLDVGLRVLSEVHLVLPGARSYGSDINDTSGSLFLFVDLVSGLDFVGSGGVVIVPSAILVLPDLCVRERVQVFKFVDQALVRCHRSEYGWNWVRRGAR